MKDLPTITMTGAEAVRMTQADAQLRAAKQAMDLAENQFNSAVDGVNSLVANILQRAEVTAPPETPWVMDLDGEDAVLTPLDMPAKPAMAPVPAVPATPADD